MVMDKTDMPPTSPRGKPVLVGQYFHRSVEEKLQYITLPFLKVVNNCQDFHGENNHKKATQ